MNDKPRPTWSQLTAHARGSAPPVVDVRNAVMANIRRGESPHASRDSLSLLGAVDAMMNRSWARAFVVMLALVAGGVAYEGYRGSGLIDMIGGFVM